MFRRTLLGATTDVDRGGERSGESLILLGISARRMLPQAHGNDAIAGIFGKPPFDFRN